MSNENKCCDDRQVNFCDKRFNALDNKVAEMREEMREKMAELHLEMKSLAAKVMNGLTERITQHDHHITVIQEKMALDSMLRERQIARKSRWEAALISMCIMTLAGMAYFLAKLYFTKTP